MKLTRINHSSIPEKQGNLQIAMGFALAMTGRTLKGAIAIVVPPDGFIGPEGLRFGKQNSPRRPFKLTLVCKMGAGTETTVNRCPQIHYGSDCGKFQIQLAKGNTYQSHRYFLVCHADLQVAEKRQNLMITRSRGFYMCPESHEPFL